MSYLLDTSVISELVKKNPRRQVVDWIEGQEESALFLSVLTIGEIEKGIAKLPASPRKTRLISWVRHDLPARFGGRLIPIDVRISSRWGAIAGESEKRGRPLPVIDSLLAATALVHGFEIVTRNLHDFEPCGVPCISPWDD